MKKTRIVLGLFAILTVTAMLVLPNFAGAQSPQNEEQENEEEEIWMWVPTSPDGKGPLVKVKIKPYPEGLTMQDKINAPHGPNPNPEWNLCDSDSPYYDLEARQ
jgi:hypothetical protein